jgi:hypothetical protein
VSATGLSALYEALARAAERLGLDGLAVAADDPDLGHQVFAAGGDARATLAELVAEPTRRWSARPAPAEPPAEVDALVALAATALRLGPLDPGADPESELEVLVRGLPHVTGVLRTGTVIEAMVTPGHHDDVVGRLTVAPLPAGGAIVLREADTDAADGDAASLARARAELIDVRTMPERGELEVHLRAGGQRTIGRGPLARAGQAAAAATLDALAGLGPEPPPSAHWRVGWVRTIDTTADREFLVAVMIRRGVDRSLHGLAAGSSPVEGAARATLHACNRAAGWPIPE